MSPKNGKEITEETAPALPEEGEEERQEEALEEVVLEKVSNGNPVMVRLANLEGDMELAKAAFTELFERAQALEEENRKLKEDVIHHKIRLRQIQDLEGKFAIFNRRLQRVEEGRPREAAVR